MWQRYMHRHMHLYPVCGMALQKLRFLVARRSPGAASVRGSGQLVGEVSLFEAGGPGAVWQTSVRASVATAALRLTAAHLRALLSSRPEAEAAVRAGAASPVLRGPGHVTIWSNGTRHSHPHQPPAVAEGLQSGAHPLLLSHSLNRCDCM